MLRTSFFIGLIWIAGACVPSRTYEVVVRNESQTPVTVWLTKDGPPVESKWKAPEHYAIERPGQTEKISGVIIAPGQAGETGKVRGKFPAGTEAILRVYLGEKNIDDMLAISRGSPNRIDVTLEPGMNDLAVRDRRGQTVVERAAAPATPGK